MDQFHQEKERSRQDLGIDFSNESSDLEKNIDTNFNDNKLPDLDSITVLVQTTNQQGKNMLTNH